MTPDFDAPQEGTSTPADISTGEPTLPDTRTAGDLAPEPDASAPENLLDQNLDETNVEDALRSRITISTLASMASLDVVIPGGGMLAGLYDTLFRSREMNDDFSISNLGGTLEEYFEYKLGEVDANGVKIKTVEDDADDLGEVFDRVREQKEREQQELEAWAESEHSFAGQEMTGEEWGQLANDISPNGKLHKKLVQWYVNNGKTPAEAEKKAGEDEELYRIEAKPPSQRTPDEQRKIDQANTDPEFRAATGFLKNERDTNFNPVSSAEQTTIVASQAASTSTRIDTLDVDGSVAIPPVKTAVISTPSRSSAATDFPSAPDLTEHHQAALAATVPLDTPKPQIAAVVAAPAPGGGFDV